MITVRDMRELHPGASNFQWLRKSNLKRTAKTCLSLPVVARIVSGPRFLLRLFKIELDSLFRNPLEFLRRALARLSFSSGSHLLPEERLSRSLRWRRRNAPSPTERNPTPLIVAHRYRRFFLTLWVSSTFFCWFTSLS